VTTPIDPVSGVGAPERATASDASPPPVGPEAVAQQITATNRVIASAHEHGRKAARLRDVLLARLCFAVARRLARMAYRFALAGKRRVAG